MSLVELASKMRGNDTREESVESEFTKILGGLSDEQFWEWVRTWKDPDALKREAECWDAEKKLAEIKKLTTIV